MKRKRFTAEQIIKILKEAELGIKLPNYVVNTVLRNRRSTTGVTSMAAWISAKRKG